MRNARGNNDDAGGVTDIRHHSRARYRGSKDLFAQHSRDVRDNCGTGETEQISNNRTHCADARDSRSTADAGYCSEFVDSYV